jgi:hypothetical protein
VTGAPQLFFNTEDAEDTENGYFMGNYGAFSMSSAVKNLTYYRSSLPKTLRRPGKRQGCGPEKFKILCFFEHLQHFYLP